MWSHLRLTVLHVEYRAEQPCRLPEYQGSMLRGSLGHALREVACFDESGPCRRCPHTDRCAAGSLFDLPNPADSKSRFDRPMPYVLTPPLDGRVEFEAGDGFLLTLALVGNGRVWLPWVMGALAWMGQQGFGQERYPFKLARIWAEVPVGHLHELHMRSWSVGEWVGEISGSSIVAAYPPRDRVTIHFLTPTDLRRKGQRIERLDGAILMSRLLRRLGGLLQTYCRWCPGGFDFTTLVDEASGILCRDQSLEFRHLERLSTRQGARHPLSGIIGRVELSQIPARLWPYLVAGERTHVGKGASFGMGKYVLE